MPNNLSAYATQKAKQYGIPTSLFLAMGGQESGGSQARGGKTITSPKGAKGWGQLMPGTAAGLHVNPDDPLQNIDGAARYLKQQYDTFGSWRLALAAYNAGPNAVREHGGVPPFHETVEYVHNILEKAGAFQPPNLGSQLGAGHTEQPGVRPADTNAHFDLVQQMESDLASGTYDPIKSLGQLRKSQTASPIEAGTPGQTAPPPQQRGLQSRNTEEWVKMAPTADRAGVQTQQPVLDFVASIAQNLGKPLTIGTGSNHDEFVAGTQRESAHWQGMAADIPASGQKLRNLGRIALIEAGVPPLEAKKKARKGGLFNVGPYQIIFATNEGGNHFNHLHVGVRG